MSSNVKLGRVNIPLIPVILAVPKAIKAVRKVAKDDREADSDGGEKITASEVADAIKAFTSTLATLILDDVLEANGIK